MYDMNVEVDEGDYEYEYEYDEDSFDLDFADPGGRSALRRATADNPRIYPCPTCGLKDVLMLSDVRAGYQCDFCADEDEGRVWEY